MTNEEVKQQEIADDATVFALAGAMINAYYCMLLKNTQAVTVSFQATRNLILANPGFTDRFRKRQDELTNKLKEEDAHEQQPQLFI